MRGVLPKTKGGLRPIDLWYSRHTGKIISRRRSVASINQYAGSKLEFWNACVKEARVALGFVGFQICGGKTADGKRLLAHARAIKRIRGGAPP